VEDLQALVGQEVGGSLLCSQSLGIGRRVHWPGTRAAER
jgi:hypothetical protein